MIKLRRILTCDPCFAQRMLLELLEAIEAADFQEQGSEIHLALKRFLKVQEIHLAVEGEMNFFLEGNQQDQKEPLAKGAHPHLRVNLLSSYTSILVDIYYSG